MDTIRDKLIKIMALAESGIEGEKETAKRMLRELCRKHHVHPETLLSPKKQLHRFRHRGGMDRILLILCAKFIAGNCAAVINQKLFLLELTKAQAIDISDMLRHYRKAWRTDIKDFWVAFINRHHLVPPSNDSQKEEMDPERLMRLMVMMSGIQSETWIRPTASLSGAI